MSATSIGIKPHRKKITVEKSTKRKKCKMLATGSKIQLFAIKDGELKGRNIDDVGLVDNLSDEIKVVMQKCK